MLGINNLGVEFNRKSVLRDINLEIASGSVALCGANGAEKQQSYLL